MPVSSAFLSACTNAHAHKAYLCGFSLWAALATLLVSFDASCREHGFIDVSSSTFLERECFFLSALLELTQTQTITSLVAQH